MGINGKYYQFHPSLDKIRHQFAPFALFPFLEIISGCSACRSQNPSFFAVFVRHISSIILNITGTRAPVKKYNNTIALFFYVCYNVFVVNWLFAAYR